MLRVPMVLATPAFLQSSLDFFPGFLRRRALHALDVAGFTQRF